MTLVEELKERVMSNGRLSREEACALFREPLEELSRAADEIRRHYCKDGFDIKEQFPTILKYTMKSRLMNFRKRTIIKIGRASCRERV